MVMPKGLLAWRKRQRPGAIMKPSTFENIKEKAKSRYGIGEERASAVAGRAYWKTARAKYGNSARGSGVFSDSEIAQGFRRLK